MAQPNCTGITFGVELEFLCAGFDKPPRRSGGSSLSASATGSGYSYHNQEEWLIGWRRAAAAEVVRFAPHLPIAVKCYHSKLTAPVCPACWGLPGTDGAAVLSEGTGTRPSDVHAQYRYFLIKKEQLTQLQSQLDWLCVEISSPVFEQQELLAGLPQIKQLVTALAQARMEIRANKSCGLHIHVGPRGGMRLLDAKKLVTLVMMLEQPLLYEIAASYRKRCPSASTILTSRYKIMHDASKADETLPKDDSESMHEYLPWTRGTLRPLSWNNYEPEVCHDLLRLVWHTKSLWKLDKQLRHNGDNETGLGLCLRNPGELEFVNLDGYWDWDSDSSESSCRTKSSKWSNHVPEFEGSRCSTFEFRFSQMSFDVDVIKDWAALGCRLVDLAALPSVDFSCFVDKLLNVLVNSEEEDASCKRRRTLRLLELGDQNVRWDARIPRRDSSDGFAPRVSEPMSRPKPGVTSEDGLEDRLMFTRL
ncbi:hypothetical protein HIM_08792 [Hirsutella minnesotensis 3608]|uniref:Amidoligase enzyme n=1 Tax=Hirsutella minnesotensis 3608 TaxID=1043627 RepID=A0A0F7ZH09_9HYPO|nr:hypothetical protein HIM_08792 [Hirsutella minnesotensis 3608]